MTSLYRQGAYWQGAYWQGRYWLGDYWVSVPDTTAPTITSASSGSVSENVVLAFSLTANEAVTWTTVGGVDQARFEISGSTLRWASNGTKDFEAPNDSNTNNTYVVDVRATDGSSNTADQTITITVLDVVEGGAWATLIDPAQGGAESGWGGNTNRMVYGTAAYDGGAPATGTKIRVTLLGPSSGVSDVLAAYVGHAAAAGDPSDFDGNQVQLKVSTSGTFTLGTSTVVLCDEVNFSFEKTKNLVVAVAVGANSGFSKITGLDGNYTDFFKAGNDAATTDGSGYSANGSGANYFVDLIEVFS